MADVLPTGHKSVVHKVVFEESEALKNHRIVAAPIAGFSGEVVVEPSKPFHFSSKYGTQIYVIPKSVTELPKFDRDVYSKWPHCKLPRGEIRSVVVTSPVKTALTTVRLVKVDSDGPLVELVKHEEFNSYGRLITESEQRATHFFLMSLPVLLGVAIGWFIFLRKKTQAGQPVLHDTQSVEAG